MKQPAIHHTPITPSASDACNLKNFPGAGQWERSTFRPAPCKLMAASIAAASFLAGAAQAQTTYLATDLGAGTYGAALNDSGTVVGSQHFGDGSVKPFVYEAGTLTVLSIPGFNGYLGANAINNAGVIAGSGYINANTYAQPFESFIYDHGTVTHISNAGGTTATQGINDSGVVTGGFALNYGNFFWNTYTFANNTFHDLGAFSPSWVTYGLAINNSGTVVGYHSNPNSNTGRHAFSYSGGTYTDIGTLPGGSQATAAAINEAGWIAGSSATATSDNHAFLYHSGTMEDLGTLGGATSIAYGINDGGSVVGESATATSAGHAFVYSGGFVLDLNDRLESPIGSTLTSALDINNAGQIVAQGADGHAYLLTPTSVPEPVTTGAVFGLAALTYGLFRRRTQPAQTA